MCVGIEAEKKLLCDDHLIYALSLDDLLKEKSYLVMRMSMIDEKKRDLVKQRQILESLSGKVSKRIAELRNADNNSRAEENKTDKKIKLLKSVVVLLNELQIDTTKINEEIHKLKGCGPEPDPNMNTARI